jgi:hypothetical protein
MDRYLEDVKKLQDVIGKTKDADVLANFKKALAALQITDYMEVNPSPNPLFSSVTPAPWLWVLY